ncbi:MAG: response regulator [Candidatus Colwellbacteria bacterium]|nr:response regulator [Candidatus Colwellbacteria bacterium]
MAAHIILIADDEPGFIEVYKKCLEKEGYSVITAKDGSEAIGLCKNRKPDLILMDVNMPNIDGVEAFMKLRENPETKDIKVIFITSFGEKIKPAEDEKLAKEIGAVDFWKKGGDLKEFVGIVKKHLKEN